MKEQSLHLSNFQFTRFMIGLLLGILVGVLFCLFSSHSTAQRENRQLNREQAQRENRASERRIALVIGNGAYQNVKPLKNPPNDATLLAATLRKLGFEVTVGTDKSQREMKQLIREFGQRLRGGGGVGLFYFAGHGVQARGHNYLVPVDAEIQTEADLEDAAVDVNYVLNVMDDAQNALNIAILDACRNNPFARSFRSAQDGLAQVKAPTGTLIAYATAPDSVAADGGGANSPYAEELTKQIQVSGVLLETMFRRVAEQVSSRSGGRQEPWYSANVKGDFYFSGTTNLSLSNTPGKIDAVAVEREYWETIRSSDDAQDYKDYLQAYPNGAYAVVARAKLRQLGTASKPSQNDVPIASRPVIKPSTTSIGLVAYWPFNGNANDESGHGFHGIVYGATLTNDRFGSPARAYDFDGTKNYIAFPSVSLSNLSQGTVSVWFKLGSLNRTQVIIDKTITNSVNYFQINIHDNSLIHNKIMLRVNDRYGTTNSNLLSDMSPSIAEWHNIVAVWDGTVGKIYLDGRLEASASMASSIPASDRSVLVGKADNDTAYLKGTIDDIRIYNRVLSEEEIRSLYNEKS